MKKIIAVVSILLPLCAQAGTWTGWGNVTEIQTYASSSFRFKTSASFLGNQKGAEPCGSGWYVVSDFTGLHKESISLVLTAFTANQQIRVNVSGCGGYNASDTQANYINVKK